MNTTVLKLNQYYFSKQHKKTMKYCGIQNYQGKQYFNFFEPVMRLFYWLDLEDVILVQPAEKQV